MRGVTHQDHPARVPGRQVRHVEKIERRDMRRIARAMNASVLPVEELLVARVA